METAPNGGPRRWLLAVIIVVVIPLVAFGVGIAVLAKYQSELHAVVEADIGRQLTNEERADPAIQISTICADPALAGEAVCGDVRIANLTTLLAIAGVGVGTALLLLVAFLRARASRDREALLRLFRPGLYVTLAGLVALVLVDGILAVSAVYLGIGVLIGWIFPVLIAGIGLAALLAAIGIIRAAWRASRPAMSDVVARRVEPGNQPRLFDLVNDVAATAGTEAPDHVLLGLDPEFYVSEVETRAIDGRWKGRTLYLSLPLSRILSVEELRAIIGHEMGHFLGSDTAFSRRFYPVYAGASGAVNALTSATGGDGVRAIALLPALVILGLFMEGFAIPERSMSRERELAADKVGARVASERSIASSLVKLTAFTRRWGDTLEEVADSVRAGKPIANASEAFVDLVRTPRVPGDGDPSEIDPGDLASLDEEQIAHPTDTHPPLTERLAAFGLAAAAVEGAVDDVEPNRPAAELVADIGAIEAELTAWMEKGVTAAVAKAAKAARLQGDDPAIYGPPPES